MIKLVVFDWSGVIYDNVEIVSEVVNQISARFGGPEISFEEFKREWEQPYMNFWHKYLPHMALAEEMAAYEAVYPEVIKKMPRQAYPKIIEVVKEIKEAGKEMVVLTSDLDYNVAAEIEIFGLSGIFGEIICGVHDKTESLRNLVAHKKYDPSEVIFIGDTTHEITAGREIGTQTMAVTWGIQSEKKLKAAKPDYLVHTVEELKATVLK
jgi:phosphoglycolate phosphatase